MATWYTADPHLGHARIIELAGRPFATVEAMDWALVETWNSVVSEDDTVWVLGDVALGKLDDSLAHVSLLNGRKLLVRGNHDRGWAGDRRLHQGSIEKTMRFRVESRDTYLRAGFAEVLDGTMEDGGWLLSHFPYVGDSHDADRHTEHRPKDRGGWLVHGHVHSAWRQRDRQINVGVDAWAGRPVPATEIAALIDAGPQDLAPLDWPWN